jgi:hypothetical protein
MFENLLASDRSSDLIVAVGENGTIMTSEDSLDWRIQESGTSATLRGIAYGNRVFVAVGGDENGGLILISTNGLNWSVGLSPTYRFNGIKYADGKFVAVGNAGSVAVSTNATDFLVTQIGTQDLNAVAFGELYNNAFFSHWVCVGKESAFYTSPDAFTWTQRFAPSPKEFIGVAGISQYRPDVVAFVTVTTRGEVFSSRDGKSWDAEPALEKFDAAGASSRGALGNGAEGIFTVFGSGGKLFESRDGTAWKPVSTLTTNTIRSVTFLNGGILAIGDTGTIAGGLHFVLRKSLPRAGFVSAASGNGRVMMGASDTRLLVSSDARTWQTTTVTGNLLGFANGNFFVEKNNRVETSADGVTWKEWGAFAFAPSEARTPHITSIAFGNGVYVVGQDYLIDTRETQEFLRTQSSTNLIDWQPSQPYLSPFAGGYRGAISFGNGRFVWANPNLYASGNAQNWTSVFTEAVKTTGLAFSGEIFLGLTGDLFLDGLAFSSKNAEQWSVTNGVRAGPLVYGNNVFATTQAYNGTPTLQISADGRIWEDSILDVLPTTTILSFKGSFIFGAAGNQGFIFQSNPVGNVQLISGVDDGRIAVRETGKIGQEAKVQQSLDLVHWQSFTIIPSEGLNEPILITPTNTSEYFRAVTQ